MKIAIIGAMEEEVLKLRSQLTHLSTTKKASSEIYYGQLYGIDIALLKSGIGKVAAAVGTALLLNEFSADIVINTGSAGGLSPQLNIGDIVISDDVAYHDVDLTPFNYLPGQMAGCPLTFKAATDLVELAQSCANTLHLTSAKGLICSGDSFISNTMMQKQILSIHPTAIAVEMEAAAIAQTCYQFNIPFVVARAISDVPNKNSPLDFDTFLHLAAEKSSQLVMTMIKNISATA